MATRTRRAIWRSGPDNGWHEELVWYAAGIHQMRQRTPGYDDFLQILFDALTGAPGGSPNPLQDLVAIASQWEDPRGLGYQSQVHGTWVPTSSWPQIMGGQALWQECAHSQWFFLPWHRAYLVEFEDVVREHIRDLGGPADTWALPYWNYSDDPDAALQRGLPLPLQGDTLPDGVQVPGVDARPDGSFPNPLFIGARFGPDPANPNNPQWADATDALLRPHYANQQDRAAVSFAGGVIEKPNDQELFHGRANETGQVDAQPHGSVHVEVNGAMGQFQSAGLDPVFWLHHCNVDRLWETYAHDLGHGYPFDNGVAVGTAAHTSWLNRPFTFLRTDGSLRTWTAPEVLDVAALGYTYETTAPPPLPANPPPPPFGAQTDPIGFTVPVAQPIAEAGPFSLAGEQDVAVSGGTPADQANGVEAFDATTWLLRFEGIRSGAPAATSYLVFLGLEPGTPADPRDADHYAGLLSLFGVYESSVDGASPGSGQRRLLDVTAQVAAQSTTFRPMATSVRLVPLNSERNLDRMQLSIDRVTVEVA
ncbi:tyrosinase family protein [Petropleomorpha daqingensis]|uniref:Tyrosinase n=1 Tax=Petropleomorpha daqingensis TaxID=2026353 RepID=A0A853CK14_9ACTN|nr:tyrosinase family protein [Petropleomorpha daqingensis]NYJ06608.1 tyrosinase [Petropleomorpha daqingensis]